MSWIPVTERLPDEQEFVLTYNPYGGIWIGKRYEDRLLPFVTQTEERISFVTHWMPLPEAPKETE